MQFIIVTSICVRIVQRRVNIYPGAQRTLSVDGILLIH